MIVLTAILLLTLNLRPAVTVVSPVIRRIAADLGLTATQTGVLGSLPPFCFAAAGLIIPRLLRRSAAERLALSALVVIACGELLRPVIGSPGGFLVLSTVALVAMGAGNVLLPPIVKAWFPARIGLVTALYVSGVTAGTAVPPLLAVPVADAVQRVSGSATTGWQVSIGWWGLFAAVVALAWSVPAAAPRAVPAAAVPAAVDVAGPGALPSSREPGPLALGRRPVWRSRTAWGIALFFAGNALSTYALFAWLPSRLIDAGVTPASAGIALAVMGSMGVPCSLLVPPIAVRVRNHLGIVLFFTACFALGELGLLLAPTAATLLWAALCGLGGGAFPLALTLVGLRSRTPHTAGVVSGFVQGCAYLIAGAGPITVGVLHERVGGWTAPLAFLLVTLVTMVVGGWLVRRPAMVDDELSAPDTLIR